MNNERNFDPTQKSEITVDRRDFLKLAGGGLFILFTVSTTTNAFQEEQREGKLSTDFNAFLRIDEKGHVTCFTGKIEMGQGIITSLAQMLADELDVSIDSIKIVMGDTDVCPFDSGTWGSMTTRFFGPPMRAAAAEARIILIDMASEKLHVPPKKLTAKNGYVFETANTKNKISYAQLTKGQKIEHHLKEKPNVKDSSQFQIVGRPFTRVDAKEKVTGKAIFTADLKLPGMLYAKIVRPPAHGAKLIDVDFSEAQKTPGIQVVRDGELAAVLHTYPDVAEQALQKVKAVFSPSQNTLTNENLYGHFLEVAGSPEIKSQKGDLKSGERAAIHICDETFYDNYIAHSPIEPHAALAQLDGEKLTIWASTQTPFGTREDVAKDLGMSVKNVRVVVPFIGGGFGGKIINFQAHEAARLAKLTGKPIMVSFTRREEFFYDAFHPASMIKIRSGMNGDNEIISWDYSSYFAGDRGAYNFYSVPNEVIKTIYAQKGNQGHPFTVGAWRGPNNNTNTFARESMMDMLAVKAGMDPYDFRMKQLKDGKFRELLEVAATKFGYAHSSSSPSGRGFGMALGDDAGTAVAMFADIDVDKTTGKVVVHKITCVQNMGLAINPEGAAMQMEGCITMGLGYALTEEVNFKNGEVINQNFDSYEIPKFSWLPKMDTIILDKHNEPPQGGGEPAIITVGAAIANAIFDKIGVRLHTLPCTPERIKAALGKL
jgi:isoquinoline 1-oxidoreductase